MSGFSEKRNKIIVLHIIDFLVKGGANTQLRYLVGDSISNISHYVCHIDQQNADIILPNATSIVIPRSKFRINLFPTYWKLLKTFKKINPDIVHLWLPEYLTLLTGLLAKYYKVPIVSSQRRAIFFRSKKSKGSLRDVFIFFQHYLANIIIPNFDDEIVGDRILRWFNSDKIYTIENGFEYSSCPIFYKSFKSQIDVIIVSRLATHKNIKFVLEAIGQSKLPTPVDRIIVFGDGPEFANLDSLSKRYSHTMQVSFKGYVPNWWLQCDPTKSVLVSASLNEGTPNVVVEALQNGIRVMISNIVEHKAAFASIQGIYYFDPYSSVSFTSTLLELTSNCSAASCSQGFEKDDALTRTFAAWLTNHSIPSMRGEYSKLYSIVCDRFREP